MAQSSSSSCSHQLRKKKTEVILTAIILFYRLPMVKRTYQILLSVYANSLPSHARVRVGSVL